MRREAIRVRVGERRRVLMRRYGVRQRLRRCRRPRRTGGQPSPPGGGERWSSPPPDPSRPPRRGPAAGLGVGRRLQGDGRAARTQMILANVPGQGEHPGLDLRGIP